MGTLPHLACRTLFSHKPVRRKPLSCRYSSILGGHRARAIRGAENGERLNRPIRQHKVDKNDF